MRGGFLKQQASGGLKRAKSSVEQTAGESHIDNTVLPNILTKVRAQFNFPPLFSKLRNDSFIHYIPFLG